MQILRLSKFLNWNVIEVTLRDPLSSVAKFARLLQTSSWRRAMSLPRLLWQRRWVGTLGSLSAYTSSQAVKLRQFVERAWLLQLDLHLTAAVIRLT